MKAIITYEMKMNLTDVMKGGDCYHPPLQFTFGKHLLKLAMVSCLEGIDYTGDHLMSYLMLARWFG